MSIANNSNYFCMSDVILYRKEHKLCLGCQIKSLDYINMQLAVTASIAEIRFKPEHESFVRNYCLKEDEESKAIVRHLLGVDYKASFVVYHKLDTERCYHFNVVKLDHLLEADILLPIKKNVKRCIIY